MKFFLKTQEVYSITPDSMDSNVRWDNSAKGSPWVIREGPVVHFSRSRRSPELGFSRAGGGVRWGQEGSECPNNPPPRPQAEVPWEPGQPAW